MTNKQETLYHYCAMQQNDKGLLIYAHGTLRCDGVMRTDEDYDKIVASIGSDFPHPDGVTILSLTRLT